MSKIRVVLQKNYEKYKFLKVFLIVYFTNYLRFIASLWEYEK